MLGNTAPDALKFMRDLAVLAGTDAASRIYITQAPQPATFPLVILSIVDVERSPTQASGSVVDTYRIQASTFVKQSTNISDPSAFETANLIDYTLRSVWSRAKSVTGDYDNAVDSIQEEGTNQNFIPDENVYTINSDYMVRVAGGGTTVSVSGQIVVKSNVIYRTKVDLIYLDFAIAATSNTINLGFSLPAKGIITMTTLQTTSFFSGGLISAYTLELGLTGSTDKYLFAQDVFTDAATPEVVQLSTALESMSAATVLKITARSTGANLNAATAGAVSIWIYYTILN